MADDLHSSQSCQEAGKTSTSSFDNRVYKAIAKINGEINRMTKDALRRKLEENKLDTRGDKVIMKKRLKLFYKRQKLSKFSIKASCSSTPFKYLMVIDFEATCEQGISNDYPHEIIEFPMVLIDVANKTVVDIFHEHVRPTLNPHLSVFCRELTGITQAQVDAADEFPIVLDRFVAWMKDHDLLDRRKFAVVSDGPWDMSRFMYKQCQHSGIKVPSWATRWINIRKHFSNFYGAKSCGLQLMLETLGMRFEGRQHCGLDDTKNIARIVIHLLIDGAELHVNERMSQRQIEATATTHIDHFNVQNHDATVETVQRDRSKDLDPDVSSTSKETPPSFGPDDLISKTEKLNLDTSSLRIESNDDGDINDLLVYYALQKQ